MQAWLSDGVAKEIKDFIRWKIKPDRKGRWKFRENHDSVTILCDETSLEHAPSVQIVDFPNQKRPEVAVVTDCAMKVTAKISQLAIEEFRDIEGRELSDLCIDDIIKITAMEIQLFTSGNETERLMLLIQGLSSNGTNGPRNSKLPHLTESSRIQDAMEYLGLAPPSQNESPPVKIQAVEGHERIDNLTDSEQLEFASQENHSTPISPVFATQAASCAQARPKNSHYRDETQMNNPLLVLLQKQENSSCISVQNDTSPQNKIDEHGAEYDIKVPSTLYQERDTPLPAAKRRKTGDGRAENDIHDTTNASQMPSTPPLVARNVNDGDVEDNTVLVSSKSPNQSADLASTDFQDQTLPSPRPDGQNVRAPSPAAKEPFFAFAHKPWAANGPCEAQRKLLAQPGSWAYPDSGDPLERVNIPIEILISIRKGFDLEESPSNADAESSSSSSSNVTEAEKQAKTTEDNEEYDDSDEEMLSPDQSVLDWSESEEAQSPSPSPSPRHPYRAAEPDDSSAADENSPSRRPRTT